MPVHDEGQCGAQSEDGTCDSMYQGIADAPRNQSNTICAFGGRLQEPRWQNKLHLLRRRPEEHLQEDLRQGSVRSAGSKYPGAVPT